MNDALIVLDVQEVFFAEPNYPVFNENKLISNINRLIDFFRVQGKAIVFVRHIDDDLAKETSSWEVCSEINAKDTDCYVDKCTPDAF